MAKGSDMGSMASFVVRQPYGRHGSGSRVLVLLLATVGGMACSSVPGAYANSDGAALGNHDGSASDEGETKTGGSYGGGIDGGGIEGIPIAPGVPAVRPLAPLSTATVTSRRPTFHWVRPDGVDGARVQVCRDRGCATVMAVFDGVDAAAPTTDLPSGALFWRAFSITAQGRTVTPSPTWEVFVGARSAPIDTSWGTILDVNGDGYADVLVTAPYANSTAGEASMYLGGPNGPATTPAVVLAGPDGPSYYFGAFASSAGDVNGDGYADAVISNGGSAAYVYLGGPNGIGASPDATMRSGQMAGGAFGNHLAGVGDVNGDGYGDVAVSDNLAGAVYVFFGSATGPASSPSFTLKNPTSPPTGNFGHSFDNAGDVNGDGYTDLVVGANPAGRNDLGHVYLYLGTAAGLPATPTFTLTNPAGQQTDFGRLSNAGDVNGDGYADLVVGDDGFGGTTGRAYIYLGGPTGYSGAPQVALDGPDGPIGCFGRWVSGAEDINGDGYADVVVGADAEALLSSTPDGSAAQPAGWAHVYFGSAGGVAASPTITLVGPDGPDTWFGRSVSGVGDVNRDGYADVLVGAPASNTNAVGWGHLYFGNAQGVPTSPSVSFEGPAPGSHFGLSVAALVRP